jgi:Uncharacterized protein family UPF0029
MESVLYSVSFGK